MFQAISQCGQTSISQQHVVTLASVLLDGLGFSRMRGERINKVSFMSKKCTIDHPQSSRKTSIMYFITHYRINININLLNLYVTHQTRI